MILRSNNQLFIPSVLWNRFKKPSSLFFCIETGTNSYYLCDNTIIENENFVDQSIEELKIYNGKIIFTSNIKKILKIRSGDDISFTLVPYMQKYKLYVYRTDMGY